MKIVNAVLWILGLIRRLWAESRIRSEHKKNRFLSALQIGKTKKLEILPLFEACTHLNLKSGYGVSYLIRTDEATILFDLGNNPDNLSPSLLEENMTLLGISLDEIDSIFISHRHPDHVGGLKWWKKKSFSLNGTRQVDLSKVVVYSCENIKYPRTKIETVISPAVLGPGVASTGKFTFYESYPMWQLTPTDCEHALAINVEDKGIVLVVGCGHMGLEALIDRTKYLFKEPIIGVVGGLHYGKSGKIELASDIQLLNELPLKLLCISPHDSYPNVLKVIEEEFHEISRPILVGETLSFH